MLGRRRRRQIQGHTCPRDYGRTRRTSGPDWPASRRGPGSGPDPRQVEPDEGYSSWRIVGRCAARARQRQRRVGGALGGEHAGPGDEHVGDVMAPAAAVDDGVGGIVAHLRRADDVTRTEREADVMALVASSSSKNRCGGSSALAMPSSTYRSDREVEPRPRMPMASRKSTRRRDAVVRVRAPAPSTSRSGSPITGRQIRTTRAQPTSLLDHRTDCAYRSPMATGGMYRTAGRCGG